MSPSDSLFVLFQDNANGLEDPLEDVGVGVFGQEVEEEGVAHIAPTQHRVYHVTIRIIPHTSFPPVKKEPLTQAFFLTSLGQRKEANASRTLSFLLEFFV